MGGESMTNAFGSFGTANASGGECVVTYDNVITAMGNINTRRVVLDVCPTEPLKPEVERVVAAIETAQIMVFGQFVYDELDDGCHLAAFGNGRACEQTLQPVGHLRWGVESFDKCIPRPGRQDEMILVCQVHLSLSAS
jgi:hypothetical protein